MAGKSEKTLIAEGENTVLLSFDLYTLMFTFINKSFYIPLKK